MKTRICLALFLVFFIAISIPASAQDDNQRGGYFLKLLREKQSQRSGESDHGVFDAVNEVGGTGPGGGNGTKQVESFDVGGRKVDIYVPDTLPASGHRALLVILHGGMGNSKHVRKSLQMDGMADKYGFLIAYLNGNSSRLKEQMKTWNAGDCCGSASRDKIDDVGYITSAIQVIGKKYGVDPNRIYGMGHSNGAMMTQRLMCESGIYQAAVPVSGTLGEEKTSCPAAAGKRILAIHGADDENVPIEGGRGKGISGATFRSQAYTKAVFEKSRATYQLWIVPGADHLPAHIRDGIAKQGKDMQEEVVKFLGLAEAQQQGGENGITERYWKLVELMGKPVGDISREPHIILKDGDNRVIGAGGCNSLSGSYELGAGTIRFSRMMSTRTACDVGMDVDQRFREVLEKVDTYMVNGDKLALHQGRGVPLAWFEAVYLR